jgi:hypothetical protein
MFDAVPHCLDLYCEVKDQCRRHLKRPRGGGAYDIASMFRPGPDGSCLNQIELGPEEPFAKAITLVKPVEVNATTTPATFWMCYRDGHRGGKKRHATLALAYEEAKRLASLMPNKRIYVMEAIGCMVDETDPKFSLSKARAKAG